MLSNKYAAHKHFTLHCPQQTDFIIIQVLWLFTSFR